MEKFKTSKRGANIFEGYTYIVKIEKYGEQQNQESYDH